MSLSISPIAYFADFSVRNDAPPVVAAVSPVSSLAPAREVAVSASIGDWSLIDPTPALKRETLNFAQNAPLDAGFKSQSVQREASVEATVPQQEESAQLPLPLPPVRTAEAAPPVPLPVPRPPEIQAPSPADSKVARAQAPAQARTAALPSAPANNPSFIEKLFGIKPATPPESALGYASLDGGTGIAPNARLTPAPNTTPSVGTAVYDISAQVVYMPNGEKLEAHSGLGDKLDDPRYVHVRMRGATPPGTYDLTEREKLFHGVRAIRLTPVGGNSAVYGRDGLLAHTYMLGPRGDSNGCVSFKNYDRFLQAYLKGEVRRLVVVVGRGQDLLPRIVNRNNVPAHNT